MIKFFTVFIFIISIFCAQFYAQSSPEDALQNFEENFPQEKIHVLMNKKSFIAGENIYFKAMIMDGYKPSLISTSLFLELYDGDKKLLVRKTVPILSGEAFGNIPLDAEMKENVYFLRAYTPWSTNFGEEFQWISSIPVFNPKSAEKLSLNKNADWHVTIHPESGNFLNNVQTKVAVRMRSKGNNPSSWTGSVAEAQRPDVKSWSFNLWMQMPALLY